MAKNRSLIITSGNSGSISAGPEGVLTTKIQTPAGHFLLIVDGDESGFPVLHIYPGEKAKITCYAPDGKFHLIEGNPIQKGSEIRIILNKD